MIAALILFVALPTQSPTVAAQAQKPAGKQRVLVLDLRNDGATPAHARLVTDNIVVALSRYPQLEVVSSEDVRRMVQTEGDKQAMGCTEDSCLTEIASAMGAQLVVHGSIGRLESITVVNLSLYDSKAGKSISREAIQVQRLDDLPYRVEDAAARLVAPLLGGAPAPSSSPSDASKGTPAPDAGGPKTNRLLAAGVAGGAGCCLAGALTVLPGANIVCCFGVPVYVALAGAGSAIGGGAAGGAPIGSTWIPALIAAGVGGVSAAAVGGALVLALGGDFTNLTFPMAIAAVPVGLLTGAAAAIATGLLVDDPKPLSVTPQANARAPLNSTDRYAMAY